MKPEQDIFKADLKNSKACFCIGPQNGEPLCPCDMQARGVFKRDGRWIQPETDLGEVSERAN